MNMRALPLLVVTCVSTIFIVLFVVGCDYDEGYVLEGQVAARDADSVTFVYCDEHVKIGDDLMLERYSWNTPAGNGNIEVRKTFREIGSCNGSVPENWRAHWNGKLPS